MMDSAHSEQESGSPVVVGTVESQRRRQRQSKKQKALKSIQFNIKAAKERLNAGDECLNAGDESSDASA